MRPVWEVDDTRGLVSFKAGNKTVHLVALSFPSGFLIYKMYSQPPPRNAHTHVRARARAHARTEADLSRDVHPEWSHNLKWWFMRKQKPDLINWSQGFS